MRVLVLQVKISQLHFATFFFLCSFELILLDALQIAKYILLIPTLQQTLEHFIRVCKDSLKFQRFPYFSNQPIRRKEDWKKSTISKFPYFSNQHIRKKEDWKKPTTSKFPYFSNQPTRKKEDWKKSAISKFENI